MEAYRVRGTLTRVSGNKLVIEQEGSGQMVLEWQGKDRIDEEWVDSYVGRMVECLVVNGKGTRINRA
ncbi:MAG: hypothetical protein HY672_04670 [Chloroflexi bacterium]|nr:hypothetical protein [Chloroflexota bacterium]